MGNTSTKRIGTFDDFCKAKKKQMLKESNEVAIDVPFYNEAIESVLGDLHCIAGDPISWGRLLDYIKIKFLVIDREVLDDDDSQVLAHVRDLLFQRYGDTILGGDYGCLTHDTAETGAKSLVIAQLASDILHKVRVDAGLEPAPEQEPEQKPLTTVSLDYYDEDEYFGESKHVKRVAGFGEYANLLKEQVDRIGVQHHDKALDFCLNKLKASAGSFKLDDVMRVAEKAGCGLNAYLTSFANEYLATAKIQVNENKLRRKLDQMIIVEHARQQFAHEITKEILERIKKETL